MSKYVNIFEIVRSNPNYLFYFFIGGRGIGKTYSILKECYLNKKKILYVRGTQTELDLTVNSGLNPYKAINRDLGINIQIELNKNSTTIGEYVKNGEKWERVNEIGRAVALSTFSNIKGADFSDIDIVVFDEFITKNTRTRSRTEDIDFFNLVESVIRNREVEGEEIPVVLISNADSYMSLILKSLGLINVMSGMKMNGDNVYKNEERAIYLELLEAKELLESKAKTKLYRATKGSDFYAMAIGNDFIGADYSDIKRVDFREYKPQFELNSLFFYKYKNNTKIEFICSKHKSDCNCYDNQDKSYKLYLTVIMTKFYYDKKLFFTDYNTKLEFYEKMLKN
jgi:hypothetical protein